MSSIPSPTATSSAATQSTTNVSNPSGVLDKDGFLKLFVAQLTHQDPTSPMDTNDSINQMASFSSVEQMTNMAATNTRIANALNTSSAVGLIGRTVSYVDADGNLQTGKVERVATTKDGQASLTLPKSPPNPRTSKEPKELPLS
jgi:flagellar basal-body rod modification protein FlgD